ncbi:hypothetical protein BAE44_0015264 [Dichanthelium oligosanthes]|uniref:RING-type domain-containing protein n=1 Tax=Dichanthelium oligosanthes TaxID=888268 RepID=A0A1E5VF48_9POAL|nr:hypothetical protein BAE44_0015264 [Dichanthelium oligosanthes]
MRGIVRDGILTWYFDGESVVDGDAYRGGGFGGVPASEEPITALPETTVGESETRGTKECAVCLEGSDDAYRKGGFGAVPSLPETTVVTEMMEGECTVCSESYEKGDKIRTMPCSHGFHEVCIISLDPPTRSITSSSVVRLDRLASSLALVAACPPVVGASWGTRCRPAQMEVARPSGGFLLLPHQIYHNERRPAATGPPRIRMRTAPHEFYDGSWTTRRVDDEHVDGTDSAPPAAFTAWNASGVFGGGGVPAAASAVAGLRETTAGVGGEDKACAVCLEGYAAGVAVRTMPCAHAFHGVCIVEWLSVSPYCPLCRFKLPTQAEEDAAARRLG